MEGGEPVPGDALPPPRMEEPGPHVLISDRQSLPVDAEGLARVARAALAAEGRDDAELSLSFTGTEEMEDLHRRYLGEAGPTDVLSFPLDGDGLIGDVVVCPEVAARSSPDVEAELRLLVVHGVLHLLGYDHQEEEARREMWARQERYSGVRLP